MSMSEIIKAIFMAIVLFSLFRIHIKLNRLQLLLPKEICDPYPSVKLENATIYTPRTAMLNQLLVVWSYSKSGYNLLAWVDRYLLNRLNLPDMIRRKLYESSNGKPINEELLIELDRFFMSHAWMSTLQQRASEKLFNNGNKDLYSGRACIVIHLDGKDMNECEEISIDPYLVHYNRRTGKRVDHEWVWTDWMEANVTGNFS